MAVKQKIADGKEMMCNRSVEMLSYPALLADPLVRMAMASDGVSEQEMRSLLQHVSDTLTERNGEAQDSQHEIAEPAGLG